MRAWTRGGGSLWTRKESETFKSSFRTLGGEGRGGRGRRGSRFRILIRVNAGYKESLTSPATILPRSINAFQRFHNSVLITEKRIHLDFKTIQFPSILSTYRSTSFVRDNSSFLRGHFIIRSFSGFHYSNGGKCKCNGPLLVDKIVIFGFAGERKHQRTRCA